MAIKIKTEKVWKGGVKCRKILGVECLRVRDLPPSYRRDTKDGPSCSVTIFGDFAVQEGDGGRWLIFKDGRIAVAKSIIGTKLTDVLTETEFRVLLGILEKCGDRLKRINDKIRSSWGGKETVKI